MKTNIIVKVVYFTLCLFQRFYPSEKPLHFWHHELSFFSNFPNTMNLHVLSTQSVISNTSFRFFRLFVLSEEQEEWTDPRHWPLVPMKKSENGFTSVTKYQVVSFWCINKSCSCFCKEVPSFRVQPVHEQPSVPDQRCGQVQQPALLLAPLPFVGEVDRHGPLGQRELRRWVESQLWGQFAFDGSGSLESIVDLDADATACFFEFCGNISRPLCCVGSDLPHLQQRQKI